MVRAVAANPAAPIIREEDVAWARDLTRYSIETVLDRVERFMAGSHTESDSKKLLEIIRQAGENGLSMNDIVAKSRWLRRRDRIELLSDMVESGRLEGFDVRTKTKPIKMFKFRK
jgi:hypothetical protein